MTENSAPSIGRRRFWGWALATIAATSACAPGEASAATRTSDNAVAGLVNRPDTRTGQAVAQLADSRTTALRGAIPELVGSQVLSTDSPVRTALDEIYAVDIDASTATNIEDPSSMTSAALEARYVGQGPTLVDVHGKYNDDVVAAYAAEGPGRRYVLGAGVTTVLQPLGLGSGTSLVGRGIDVTVLRAGPSLNASVLTNEDHSYGNDHITIADLTIDGNRSQQSGQAAAHAKDDSDGNVFGIEFHKVRDWALTNVEVQNVDGKGAFLIGDATVKPASYEFSLSNVYAHDNALDGIHIGGAMRRGQLANVRCYANGRDGYWSDASEAQILGVYSYGNARDGIWIRNTFACSYWNLKANKNGRHGIRVLGMVNCDGGGWSAHSNGQSGAAGAFDLWFDGNATYSYGRTDRSRITGIDCGPVNEGMPWIGGTEDGSRLVDYPLVVDAAITGDLKLLGVTAFRAGRVGLFSLPPYGVGNLVMTDLPGGTGNVRVLRGHLKNYGAVYLGIGGAVGGGLWSGAGLPNAGVGGSGDYYFRTDTPGAAGQRVYVKGSSGWQGIV